MADSQWKKCICTNVPVDTTMSQKKGARKSVVSPAPLLRRSGISSPVPGAKGLKYTFGKKAFLFRPIRGMVEWLSS